MVIHTNKIDDSLISYLEKMDSKLYNSISYSRSVSLTMLYKNDSGVAGKVPSGSSLLSSSVVSELPNSREFILSQYDVLSGTYPSSYSEMALVVDEKNQISKNTLDAIGVSDKTSYTVSDLVGKSFKVIGNDELYEKSGSVYRAKTYYDALYASTSENVFTVSISCILRVNKKAESTFLSTGLSYSYLLTDKLIDNAKTSAVVAAQTSSKDTSVLTGLKFDSTNTYDATMKTLGGDSTPIGINIYPSSFDAKAKIKSYIDKFNEGKSADDSIVYSDMAETITATMSTMINAITIVLAAVAAISLIVSTVMISIIVYVSVVERTKEIGIMRSIGARKKDISRIFSAEAVSIGAISGLFGIIVTYLLDIPVSMLIGLILKMSFTAVLLPQYALILLAVSILLTFIAGLLPARRLPRKIPSSPCGANKPKQSEGGYPSFSGLRDI